MASYDTATHVLSETQSFGYTTGNPPRATVTVKRMGLQKNKNSCRFFAVSSAVTGNNTRSCKRNLVSEWYGQNVTDLLHRHSRIDRTPMKLTLDMHNLFPQNITGIYNDSLPTWLQFRLARNKKFRMYFHSHLFTPSFQFGHRLCHSSWRIGRCHVTRQILLGFQFSQMW